MPEDSGSAASGRRTDAAADGAEEMPGGGGAARANQTGSTGSGVESGFHDGATGGWTTILRADGGGCVYQRKLGHQARTEIEGGRWRVLQRIERDRGGPKKLFCDSGSEFSSQEIDLETPQNSL